VCGRYRLTAKERWLSQYFNLSLEDVAWAARWNIAPTQEVATIRQDRRQPKRLFTLMRWGLIPYWAKDASIAARTINAMSETAAEKPTFKDAMRRRRCLIPADGFYEWRRAGGGGVKKQAYHIGLARSHSDSHSEAGLFAFAGLWDRWRSPEGSTVETFTILTTAPNSLVADIHDRMPVILRPEDYDLWLDPGVTDPARLQELLKPYDALHMRKYPVSDFVNRTDNEGPECGREVKEDGAVQGKLWKGVDD
jgi:putative SOS response-associated peptidase YedK